MGQEPDIDVQFDESSLPSDVTDLSLRQFREKIGSMDNAVKTSLEKRIDYMAYNTDIQALLASIDAAKAGYYPTVNASAGWSWANSEFSGFGDRGAPYLGLNLRVPIFENYRTDYQVESATQQVNQRQIDKAQLEQSIRLAVKTQFLSLTSAEKQLEISGRALKSAEKNFEAATENYRVGTYNITDFLNANYQVINARINRINSVYNYYLVQRELLFTIGLL
jgi:outer membrane protein TolC